MRTEQDIFTKGTYESTVRCYHSLLGGLDGNFPEDTFRRVMDFSQELRYRRNYEKFTTFPATSDEMVIGNHLRVFSFCEHHLLPFFGEATIAYIPNKKILGLSKFQRIIDKCAAKPSLQERLTKEISDMVLSLVSPKGAAVQIKAIHTCVFARGPQSSNAEFTTTSLEGLFKTSPETRNELIQFMATNSRARL